MRLKIILNIFILALCVKLYPQKFVNQLIVNTSGHNCFQYELYENKKSDTLNYYFIFETDFVKDSATVFSNDRVVFKDGLSTNQAIDLAKVVKIGEVTNTNYFSFQLNRTTIFTLYPIKGKYYMRVQYIRELDKIIVCYSKYMPYYE